MRHLVKMCLNVGIYDNTCRPGIGGVYRVNYLKQVQTLACDLFLLWWLLC